MFVDPQAYESFMGRWSRRAALLLIDFADVCNRGEILDVGCGTGPLTFAIAESRPHSGVTGVDLSNEYIAYANRQNRDRRVRFQTGDAQHLPFPDHAFDASLSLLALNFIPQPDLALTEIRRVTRRGGRIAAAVWDYGGRMQMLRVFWDAAIALDPAAEHLDEKHMPLCHAGELSRLWSCGGLEQVDEEPLEIEMKFLSFEDYWAPFLLGQGPAGAYVKNLTAERVAALRDEVKRGLKLDRNDAHFALLARVWAVRGDVPD